ncbi:MAG TPA: Ig-like domain-containing protein [Thermoanaerobaculia bacterium]|nr:Ig-like domain-containing protein [Thermoanaerobaculia bacterium]
MRRSLSLLVVIALASSAIAAKHRAVRHPSPATISVANDAYFVARGGTLVRAAQAGVLANDLEVESKPLTAILVSSTTHGTIALSSDGGFTYVNDGSSATTDAFTYKASNGVSTSDAATVTIAITDAAPVALNDTFSATAGGTTSIAAPGVLANDTRNSATIASFGANGTEQTVAGNPATTTQNGSVRLAADGAVTYTPAASFLGADTFKYVLTNSGGSSTAQVTINVVPQVPVAIDDAYTTPQNTPLNEPAPGVLANDTLNNATLVSYGNTTGGEQSNPGNSTPTEKNGGIRMNADGSFTYTPPAGFSGTDTFKYRVANAGGGSTATVRITVQAPAGPDFTVTSPGFAYVFTGVSGQNPVLTLKRGRTYVFQINADAIHPFEILDAPNGAVDNNNISRGTLTFTVPNTAASYRYICSLHGFGNVIQTVP